MFPYKEDMFLQEFMNITYALRELAEPRLVDWITAFASSASILISAIAVVISSRSLKIASNIAKEQNKIALYKERYDVFCTISDYVFGMTSLADVLLKGNQHNSYPDIFLRLRYSFKCGEKYSEYKSAVDFIKDVTLEINNSTLYDGRKASFLFCTDILRDYTVLKDIFIEFLSKLENEEDLESSLKLLQQQGHYFMEHVFPKMESYFILTDSK